MANQPTGATIRDPASIVKHVVRGCLILVAVLVIPGMLRDCRQKSADRQEEARLRREIAVLRAEAARPPDPVPVVYEFELRPGESRVIETDGCPFSYRFYGTTYFYLYRGKYAAERVLFRTGSYENSLSTPNGMHKEISRIRLERHPDAKTALGYQVTVYRQPET